LTIAYDSRVGRLVITVETGQGDAAYRAAVVELASVVFEPIAGGMRGEVPVEGELAIGQHLAALAELSREHAAWRFRIEVEPDGGTLELIDGSFGDEADEVAQLLAWTAPTDEPIAAVPTSTLYASFELARYAHGAFVALVTEKLSSDDEPVIQASDQALALGFTLTGDEEHTAQLVGALRYAWITGGNLARCLVEIEGEVPHSCTIAKLEDWAELDLAMRPTPAPTDPRVLTWVDDRGRCRALVDGVVHEVEARLDATHGRTSSVVRCGDGRWVLRLATTTLELPADASFEREVLVCERSGIVLVERRGRALRLRILDGLGHRTTPVMSGAAVAVDLARRVAYVADLDLVTIDLQMIGTGRSQPWPEGTRVTDLAMVGPRLIAAADGELLMLDATCEVKRSIYVPCTNLEIVETSHETVHLLGEGPTGRVDLVRVDLGPDRALTSILTSGLDARGWGELYAIADRRRWWLAYAQRGVFALSPHQEIARLATIGSDDRITGICEVAARKLAIFIEGPHGAYAIVAGRTIDLPASGYHPRWLGVPEV